MSLETLSLLRSGQWQPSKRLAVNGGLTAFPPEIFDVADSIEILDLSDNCLSALPDDFARLHNLQAVFFFNNHFTEIPEVLSQCPQLRVVGFKANRIRQISDRALFPHIRWLILTNNQIEQLPATIGTLTNLQKLMLAGNRLRSLPEEMAACQALELIRISANQLLELPSWLLRLPRLAWLAYAGNPFSLASSQPAALPHADSIPSIEWHDLDIGEPLGQGASGVIFRGNWHPPSGETKAVAVKVFKGDMTSDGLPADEQRVCIAAGSHPHLVPVLGTVANHPDAKAGLVLSLIPPEYKILGHPPSLATCTRDTYPPDTVFSLETILRIASGIAAVMVHLHQRGIMHGDLYAHNILVNPQGDSLCSDFGAASQYSLDDPTIGAALEHIEVRAFGCLLEDLLNHVHSSDALEAPDIIATLRTLQQDCMQPNPASRPLFTTIGDRLAAVDRRV